MATILTHRADTIGRRQPQADNARLLRPSRGYSVTRNPFAIWEVLPIVTLSFAGLAVAMLFIDNEYLASMAVGGFLVFTLGMLLVSAVALKGTLDLTHEGISFQRGKDHLTASWDQIVAVENRSDCGLTLVIRDPQQTRSHIRLPGGFGAEKGVATIPLRLFGDRQFSILYDIRDRLPEAMWKPALETAGRRSTARIVLDYAAVVAVCGLALFVVLRIYS